MEMNYFFIEEKCQSHATKRCAFFAARWDALTLRLAHAMRKTFFGWGESLKKKISWPVKDFFQSSALPTELLGRIETGRERGQGDKLQKGAIKTLMQ